MIKCDPRVFSRCKYRSQCEGDAYYREGSDCEKFAKAILECPMPNSDHLQELSDEEKANLLTQVFYRAAQQYILEWLKKPMEG